MPPPDALRVSLSSSLTPDAALAACAFTPTDANTRNADTQPEAPTTTISAAQDPQVSSADKPSRVESTLCLLLVLLGCSTCAVAWTMQRVIEAMQVVHRRIEFTNSGYFIADVAAWAGFRVVLVLGAVFCTTSISPRAAGSGIPEMKCILAGMNLDEHMSNATVLAKVLGLVLMCGAGMPVGREGPLVHIAGSIALGLLRLRAFRSIAASEVRKHEVLAAACAVGVTAAFGAPLGGVLFSIEVTTTYFLTSSYWHSFACAVTGCVFFRYADAHGGMGTESSELGNAPEQQIGSSQLFDIVVLPMHVLLGVVCGLLASAFITIAAILFRFTRPWSKRYTELDEYTLTPRTRHNHRMLTMRYRKYWYAGAVALLGGLAEYSIASRGNVHSNDSSGAFMTTPLFKCTYDFMYFEDLSNATGTIRALGIDWNSQGNSLDAPHELDRSLSPTSLSGVEKLDEQTSDEDVLIGHDNVQLVDGLLGLCPAQQTSQLHSARDIQTTVYNEDWGEYGGVIGSLAIWCISKMVFASLSLTIFAPAGCLGPCIAIGAGLGRLVGESLSYCNFGCIPAAQLAIAGAAAFAGGVTGTVSVAVIVFEMTGQIDCAVPVLISVLTARAVASMFVESLYDTMLRLGRLPALPPTQSTDRQLRQVRCAKQPPPRLLSTCWMLFLDTRNPSHQFVVKKILVFAAVFYVTADHRVLWINGR